MMNIIAETISKANQNKTKINIHPAAIEMSENIFRNQMKIEHDLLVAGKIEEYKKCHEDFQNKKLPDYRPSFMDLLYGSENVPQRPCITTWNYFFKFKGDRFRVQYDFEEYLSNSFDRLIANPEFLQSPGYITKYTPEYITRFGRCDFFIEGTHPLLLELKVDKINRKDIYQGIEYQKSTDYKIPVAMVGHRISDDAKELAKESNIILYRYNVQEFAPLKLKITHVQGKHHKVIDRMGDVRYIFKEWSKYE